VYSIHSNQDITITDEMPHTIYDLLLFFHISALE